ncbi:MAG: tetratricopeptide repeat protein [Candidatus Omnitrophica bacterium]|nr:tetratricopeptide repeat protein [Candidatus Omnitrophota bacterium]
MRPTPDDRTIERRIKELVGRPPESRLPDSRAKEFVARLYKVSEEAKHIVYFATLRDARVFATVAVSVLIFIVATHFLFSPVGPVVQNASGTVKIYSARRNEWTFAKKKKGVRLARNDIVKTFSDGQADLVVKGSYHMRLKGDSEIKLARSFSRASPGGTEYMLEKGKAFTFYKKGGIVNRQFDIRTPQASVSAVGTDFMVQALPLADRTWVGVLDGAVRVTNIDTVFVEAGEKTTVHAGRPPLRPQRLMENELLELEELYSIGRKPQVALLISTGKTRTRELLNAVPLYVASARPSVLPEKMEAIVNTFNQAIRAASVDKHFESIRQLEEIVEQYSNPKYDVQFLLFIGAYYERLQEHEKAIETFRKILDKYPNSNLASIAQCAIGIIYEEKLNDPKNAIQAYQKVLSDYPQSAEIEEAQSGIKRISNHLVRP